MRSALLIFLGFLFCLFASPALAEKRVALVIGISKYQQVPRLANPTRDAERWPTVQEGRLRCRGKPARPRYRRLRRAIREFSETSRDADIAVVYYAGHGIEVDGTNYLVPADAKLFSDFDIEDETISLDRVLQGARSGQAAEARHPRRLPRQSFHEDHEAQRREPLDRPRARQIEPTMSDTLIAFAAKAGAVANDGDGQTARLRSRC